MKNNFVIVIDGPAGSGKSSTARQLALKLGFIYLDTGAMYRSVALAAIKAGIDLKDEKALGQIAESVDIDLVQDGAEHRVFLDGEDVTAAIRDPKIDSASSLVSTYKIVREKMVDLQRKFSSKGNIVAEGRDMGTVVFPGADLKIFLVANLETRAARRCMQLKDSGIEATIEEQISSMSSRDISDSGRAHSPLMKADDAKEIDTSNMTLSGQIEKIYELALEKLNKI